MFKLFYQGFAVYSWLNAQMQNLRIEKADCIYNHKDTVNINFTQVDNEKNWRKVFKLSLSAFTWFCE